MNLPINIEMGAEWLARREEAACFGTRSFRVKAGGEEFLLSVVHAPSEDMFTEPAEDPRRPEDKEVLEVIAQAFLGCLRGEEVRP